MRGKLKNGIIANRDIRAEKVQLISDTGKNLGVVAINDALRIKDELGLDLVVIANKGYDGYPVAKIMDLGKALYEKKKKEAEAKKKQKTIQIKEIKIRPKISEHDYQTKIKRGIGFLNSGKRLKITLQFRGREMIQMRQKGEELFKKINNSFSDASLTSDLVQEKDSKAGYFWSRVYYLRSVK